MPNEPEIIEFLYYTMRNVTPYSIVYLRSSKHHYIPSLPLRYTQPFYPNPFYQLLPRHSSRALRNRSRTDTDGLEKEGPRILVTRIIAMRTAGNRCHLFISVD